MSDSTDSLTLRMRATGGSTTAREVDQSSAAVKKFGTATETSGKKAIKAREQVRLFSGGLKSFTSFAASGALALGLVGFGEGIRSAIKSAEDLDAQVHQSTVVFGANAKGIQTWADTTATSLGQTKSEALAAVSGFGSLFKSLGFTTAQSADMSKKLDKVAVSLASLKNVDPSVALAALKSGVTGQTRGLRSLGIVIDANQVKQKAMQMGLYSGKGAITASAKAAASYQLILEQSKGAQNDFAKRSHSLAGEQKILSAELGNVSEEVGTALLPMLAKGAGGILTFVKQVKDGTGAGGKLRTVVMGLASAYRWEYDRARDLVKGFQDNKTWAVLLGSTIIGLTAAFVAFKTYVFVTTTAIEAFTEAQAALNLVMDANPFAIILLALVALGVAFYTAYTKSATFRNDVNGLWADMKNGGKLAIDYLERRINDVIAVLNKASSLLKTVSFGKVNAGQITPLAIGPKPFKPTPTTAKQRQASSIVKASPDLAPLLTKTSTLGFHDTKAPVKGHRASGGIITDPGVYEVGERGAEHVYLPAHSMVEPHGGWPDAVIHTHVHLDGKEVAQSVVRAAIKRKGTT